MEPYNEKRAFNVYMTFAGFFMALMVLCLCMCSCASERMPMQTNSKYIFEK